MRKESGKVEAKLKREAAAKERAIEKAEKAARQAEKMAERRKKAEEDAARAAAKPAASPPTVKALKSDTPGEEQPPARVLPKKPSKVPKYRKLNANLYHGETAGLRAQYLKDGEVELCDCNVAANGDGGCGFECMNKQLFTECGPGDYSPVNSLFPISFKLFLTLFKLFLQRARHVVKTATVATQFFNVGSSLMWSLLNASTRRDGA